MRPVAAEVPKNLETKHTPILVPTREPEPNIKLMLGLVVTASFLTRAIIFPWNENYYGDAVIRTELAERWLSDPHWITSMDDGVFQFGPLHIYLLSLFLKMWPSREDAGRLLSLLFGTASTVPLFYLTRRFFGWREALWASLAFSLWGLHVQFSTTAASEALGLCLVLSALALYARGYDEARLGPLAYSALFLNLACATRYDAWLLPPLLSALLFVADRDRIAAATRAVLFALLCLPFPALWMQGNEVATGSPIAPLRFIDEYHKTWVADGIARYGNLGYRLHNLLFWPGVALMTLTPLVAFFGFYGMLRFWRTQPRRRWLVWVALIPTAYFGFKGAILLNFSPVARFAAAQVVLLLPFVAHGFGELTARMNPGVRHFLGGLTVATAIGIPIGLGLYTFRSDGKFQDSLRPISPLSTNPRELMRVARYIKTIIAPSGGAIILDSDSAYRDLQIAFFGGLPEEQMARHRWEIFPKRLRSADPHYLVKIDGGTIEQSGDFEQRGDRVRFANKWFNEIPGFRPPYHLYRLD